MLCIDFVLFLEGRILREFQNIEKFLIFWKKKHDLVKGMCSYISNVGFNQNLSKKLDFMKNCVSFSI